MSEITPITRTEIFLNQIAENTENIGGVSSYTELEDKPTYSYETIQIDEDTQEEELVTVTETIQGDIDLAELIYDKGGVVNAARPISYFSPKLADTDESKVIDFYTIIHSDGVALEGIDETTYVWDFEIPLRYIAERSPLPQRQMIPDCVLLTSLEIISGSNVVSLDDTDISYPSEQPDWAYDILTQTLKKRIYIKASDLLPDRIGFNALFCHFTGSISGIKDCSKRW